MTADDEYALLVDLATKRAEPIAEAALQELGLTERANLQEWVETYPEMIGSDLMLITTEFDQWELRDQRVADRLDVLMLDAAGHLLVAELKRGEADDTTDLQALKYAAYCANLTVQDVVEEHARYRKIEESAARDAIVEHAPSLEENELGPVRVLLVATGFRPSVSSVVLWLNEVGLDVGCVQFTVRRVDDARAVLSTRQVLPPPQAKDYLVRRRRREAVEDQRESRKRRPQTVALLNQSGAVAPGTQVELILDVSAMNSGRPFKPRLRRTRPGAGRFGPASPAVRRCGGREMGQESSPSAIV